jgi:hypothetical protein
MQAGVKVRTIVYKKRVGVISLAADRRRPRCALEELWLRAGGVVNGDARCRGRLYSMAGDLSPKMTLRDFENGYWYHEQLKNFAGRIGIPSAKKLRKDELEKAIVAFLRTGKAALPTKRSLRKTGVKDLERGLNLKLRIENYTSNRETKDFIVEQAHLMAPDVREKSGVWYRLNRWREEQSTSGKHATYGDLVRQYIDLNKMERFEKIPQVRYINFLAAFLAANKGVTRAEAIAAWKEVKKLDVPKDYKSWVKARGKIRGDC